MNSKMLYGPNKLACAMGKDADDQMDILDQMELFLKNFAVFNKDGSLKDGKQPWQHGILCSIKSTRKLWGDLVKNGPFTFLLTSRLNQDCLENFFSRLRGTYEFIKQNFRKSIECYY